MSTIHIYESHSRSCTAAWLGDGFDTCNVGSLNGVSLLSMLMDNGLVISGETRGYALNHPLNADPEKAGSRSRTGWCIPSRQHRKGRLAFDIGTDTGAPMSA